MNEERKQELRRLLAEALESLEIRNTFRDGPSLSVDEYGKHLRERWVSYSEESRSVRDVRPEITSDETKSKIRGLIRLELGQFINEDNILSANNYVLGGRSDGFHLDRLSDQLLKITIVRGIEEAVLAFDSCTKDTPASIQCVALLEGIKLEAAIQVFEGMQLIPVPDSPSVRPCYLPRIPLRGISEDIFFSQTVLIIDYSISPMFHKPILPAAFRSEFDRQKEPFCVEVRGRDFLDFNEADFFQTFCQALSLACNFPVQIPMKWDLLAEDEFFNVSHGPLSAFWRYHIHSLFGKSTEVGEADIEKAKRLYKRLVDLDSDVMKKLRIPIDRWIKSKTPEEAIDKIIDLGIAFEALYLLDTDGKSELSFRLRLRAAWHLGKDEEDRKQLLTKFKNIYEGRSKAVHSGKLKETLEFGGEKISRSEFIAQTQDLCRESIMKVLEDGRFPDWDNLILGGEAERVGN